MTLFIISSLLLCGLPLFMSNNDLNNLKLGKKFKTIDGRTVTCEYIGHRTVYWSYIASNHIQQLFLTYKNGSSIPGDYTGNQIKK